MKVGEGGRAINAVVFVANGVGGDLSWRAGRRRVESLPARAAWMLSRRRIPILPGSKENTNGLLRDYFPKGRDLRVHSPERLMAAENELNNRPGWCSTTVLL